MHTKSHPQNSEIAQAVVDGCVRPSTSLRRPWCQGHGDVLGRGHTSTTAWDTDHAADAMPFVRCKSSKNVTSRLKKCYSVYESVWEGSNIFARRVTVDEYKVPSKMSTNTSLVRTPSTDSHVEGVLRHHPCYFSNISAIFHWYTQSMVTLNVTTK